jgi:hypothetical protein
MKKGRKKRRTAAQKAATAKMIRANKRARRSSASPKKHRRGKRRSSAREQSSAIVLYNEKRAERNARHASKPARKTRKKSTSMRKRKSGSKKHRTAAQKRATRKMIAANRSKHHTPKRKKARKSKTKPIVRRTVLRSAKRRGKRRSKAVVTTTRRRGKKGATVHLKMTGVTEKRRRRARRSRRNPIAKARRYTRNPIGSRAGYIRNPLMGGKDWALGLSGFILGGMGTVFIDRVVSTHPPTAAATGSAATDQPATGQIYNVESPSAPIWSSMLRLAVAVASVSVPFGIAAAVKGPGAKSFFQLWGFGAMSATVVKAGTDVVALLTGKNAFGSRFYAPEVSAQEDLKKAQVAGVAALPALPVPMLAGIPMRLQAPVHQIVRSAPAIVPYVAPQSIQQASPVRAAPAPVAPPVQSQPVAAPVGIGAPAEDDFNPYTAGLENNE